MHNSEQLIEFSMLVSSFVAVMQNLQFDNDLKSCSNVRIVVNKLPPNMRSRWCSNISEMPASSVTLQEFDWWLQKIASTHELLLESSERPTKATVKNEKTKSSTFSNNSGPETDKKSNNCPCCEEKHPLWKCPTFKEKPTNERVVFVREKRVCFSCLDGQHFAKNCTKKLKCKEKGCKGSHNTLLHLSEKPKNSLVANAEYATEPKVNTNKEEFKSTLPRGILQVIKVKVVAGNKETETLTLCETGSTLSWIAPSLKNKLQLHGRNQTISLQGFTGHQQLETSLYSVVVKSLDQQMEEKIEVLVKPDFWIGSDKLNVEALKEDFPHLKPIKEDVIDLSKIQVLLGQNAFKLIRPLEYQYLEEDKPWAVKLPLGWALSGPLPPTIRESSEMTGVFVEDRETNDLTMFGSIQQTKRKFGPTIPRFPYLQKKEKDELESWKPVQQLKPTISNELNKAKSDHEFISNNSEPQEHEESPAANLVVDANNSNDDPLAAQLKNWWEIEAYGSRVNVTPRSREDKKSWEILEKSTYHNGERYVVGMLWKDGKPNLPNNYIVAKSQLLTMERRLSKDEALKKRYSDTIKVDLEKKYIRKVEPEELLATRDMVQWYLPCHPVVNPNKPEKVRRVCNAASKFKGTSLNDALMTGPDLLNNLIGILLRFRSNPIVLMADVEAMFLQIGTPEDDQRTTRFLWREGPSDEITVYQYLVRIFGGTDSPTCANYALKRTGIDNQDKYSEASKVVQKDFYMDDLVKSVKSLEKAIQLFLDLRTLLKLGGFKLTKWFSNNNDLMQSFKNEGEVLGVKEGQPAILTVLGLQWDAEKDTISVARGMNPTNMTCTQRGILSAISSVFDPLGLLAPFMVKARLLLKSVWQTMGQSWDEKVNQEHAQQFEEWIHELKEAKEINLKRQYSEKEPKELELHAFADASENAMCAVLYLRAIYSDGTNDLVFVIGKSRVAPIRRMTVPKLELQAAIIATRIADQVMKEIELPISRQVFWSDSSTVLQWLQNSEKKQPVFVGNRVQEILDSTTVDQWRYVPTIDNPADHGTRGMSPQQLLSNNWFTGPEFLYKTEEHWHTALFAPTMAGNVTFVAAAATPTIEWTKFSQFTKIVNVIAYCLRIKSRFDMDKKSTVLSAIEVKKAEMLVWKMCQAEVFAEEIRAPQKESTINSSSPIKCLKPFIDSDGLLRAGGRLSRSQQLPDSSKYPIILSVKHHAVKLFLEKLHKTFYHQGVEFLRAKVQQNYWIIKLRSSLRAVKQKCQYCKKQAAKNFRPLMADLPKERINPIYPFAEVGVDFFGPFLVKFARKTLKRYGFLFTCLTTRAIHLEVCQSLDTDSCMMAVQRFIARRGQPSIIISDNGTNFVGVVKELQDCWKSWNRETLVERMAQQKITWKFIPPGSPHFGGVWERMVQSCKRSIYAILQGCRLTDETLATVFCLAEQTLNARPITAVSSDIEDLEALTPNHFILGRPCYTLPLCWTPPTIVNFKRAYKMAEMYSDQIWRRWTKEFLPQMNVRAKWNSEEKRPINVGDLVWLVDPTMPRSTYPLARVIELHTGNDGCTRSAKIRTQTGTYVRPLIKMVPLEVQSLGVPKNGNRAGDVEDQEIKT